MVAARLEVALLTPSEYYWVESEPASWFCLAMPRWSLAEREGER